MTLRLAGAAHSLTIKMCAISWQPLSAMEWWGGVNIGPVTGSGFRGDQVHADRGAGKTGYVINIQALHDSGAVGFDLLTHSRKQFHNRLFPTQEGVVDLVMGSAAFGNIIICPARLKLTRSNYPRETLTQ